MIGPLPLEPAPRSPGRRRERLPRAGPRRLVRRPGGGPRRVRLPDALRLARPRDEHPAARAEAAEAPLRLAPDARLDGPLHARTARRRAAVRSNPALRAPLRARAVRGALATRRRRRRGDHRLADARDRLVVPAAQMDRPEGLAAAALRDLRRLLPRPRSRPDHRDGPQGHRRADPRGGRGRPGDLARARPRPDAAHAGRRAAPGGRPDGRRGALSTAPGGTAWPDLAVP